MEKLTFDEAFAIRDVLKKLETSGQKFPLSFTYPVMRILRTLDKVHKDYRKAMRATHAATELEKYQKEQVELLDKILKKDHLGNYLTEGEGQDRKNVPIDQKLYDTELEKFWLKWHNQRQLNYTLNREDEEYREKELDAKLRSIKFNVIPTNIDSEYVMALMPLIEDVPEEFPELVTYEEVEDKKAA